MQSVEHWQEASACKYIRLLLLSLRREKCRAEMLGRVCVGGMGADDGARLQRWGFAISQIGTRTSGSSLDKHLSAPIGRLVAHPQASECATCEVGMIASYRTLMGPSTGSSPCSDSCFKALRAAWEEREQQMVEWGREIGWEESECHPSAAFQITLTLGNLMPAGHFPFTLCCLWLLSAHCLSKVIGLTFPLYVLAALHFPKSIRERHLYSQWPQLNK